MSGSNGGKLLLTTLQLATACGSSSTSCPSLATSDVLQYGSITSTSVGEGSPASLPPVTQCLRRNYNGEQGN